MGLTHHGWDLSPSERHVASLLGEAGYRTDLIGVHHESKRRPDAEVGVQLGFDHVDTVGGKPSECRADRVADRAIDVLRARAAEPGQPFYLQVGFMEPHRLAGAGFDGIAMGFIGDHIAPDDELGVTIPSFLQDDEGTREEIAELQGAVRYVDSAIGRMFRALEDLALTEKTIVVFTTDHGLALPRAKGTLYDPGLETALIVRAPSLGWTGGRVASDLVSNVDVVPTLLEAAGVTDPSTMHGRSVAPALRGEVRDGMYRPRSTIFGEFTYHDYYEPIRCVRSQRYKLIVNFDHAMTHAAASTQSWRPRSTPHPNALDWSKREVEFYDLHEDPLEVRNRATDPTVREVVDEMRQAMLDWMERTSDPLLDGPVPSPHYVRARANLLSARNLP